MQDEHFHFLLVSVKLQPSAAYKSVAYKIKRIEVVENLITFVLQFHLSHGVWSVFPLREWKNTPDTM